MADTFSAVDCIVTKVDAGDQNITIEFRGRWDGGDSSAPITDRNVLALLRDPGEDDGAWGKIVEAARAALNEKATITVKSPAWMIRSGVLIFRMPSSQVEITRVAAR